MSAVLIALIALAPAAASGPAGRADVCTKLPVSVVSQVLARAGVAVEHGSAQSLGTSADTQGCMYSFAGAGGNATVTVSWSELRNEQAANVVFTAQRGGIPGARPVTGIGSEAVISQTPGGATLAVRRGKGYGLIQIFAQGSVSPSALSTAVTELARLLLGAPAAAAATARPATPAAVARPAAPPAGARPAVSPAPAAKPAPAGANPTVVPATGGSTPLTLDRVIGYLGAYQDLLGIVALDRSLAQQLARHGETDAKWVKRLATAPELRNALKSWDMTPAQYIQVGRTFYDAWMTHAKLAGPGPKPQPPNPKALEFVRANAGMIAQSPGMIAVSRGQIVAPWPGGPLEQSLSGK